MYVIVRVLRIGSAEPIHLVYPDPHRALFLGRLQHVADVHLLRNASCPI
jgi:hypothetical protein